MSTEVRLRELLDRYVEHHVEHGRALPIEELCRGTPELRDPLLRLIREYHGLDRSLTPAAPFHAGEVVSDFRIQSLLGSGGMGVVYQAEDLKLRRTVAIKVLHPEMAADPERLQRLAQEARSASALNHPNIITIYDIDRHDGALFIAMEHVQGRTLTELMDQARLPLGRTLGYAVQIADGLARAHRHGIVHRDLKPDNLMVTDDGLVKILDFGLAKLTDPADPTEATAAEPGRPHTREGHILGTAPYMSPEQVQGQPVDFRSDIFSFGSVLYEMVTGKRPFAGDSAVQLLAAIVEKEPESASELLPSIPLDLERVIRRALHKEPERRFQATADLKVELQEIKEEVESGRVISADEILPAGRGQRRWVWPGAAAILAVVGIGLAIRVALEAIRPDRPPPRIVSLTTLEGYETWPALSPDGTRVAFTWDGGDVEAPDQIYVKLIDVGEPLQLTHDPTRASRPAWSPDGNHIAFARGAARDYSIYEIPSLGGAERFLGKTTASGAPHLSWSPSGDHLAIQDRVSPDGPDAIFLLSRETGERRQLSGAGGRQAAFSPDGRSVAFVRSAPGWRNADLYLVDNSSGEETRLTFDQAEIASVDWTSDGRHLVFSSARGGDIGSLWTIPRKGGEPVGLAVGAEASWISTSRKGNRLVYSRSTTDYDLWRVSGPRAKVPVGPTRFYASSRIDSNPKYSPDGTRIALMTARSGQYEVWVCKSDGQACRFLTPGSSYSWSPDGTHIAFTTTTSKQFRGIGIIGAEGGFPRFVVEDGWNGRPKWSRDGEWIYFQRAFRGDRTEIWKVRSEGGEVQKVAAEGGYVARESEDRRHLYYEKRLPGGAGQIWKMPVGGGEARLVLDRLPWPRTWSIWRGFLLFFAPEGEAGPSIESLDLATGEVSAVAPLGPDAWVFRGLDVSPDGEWIVYTNRDAQGSDLYLLENFHVD